MANYTDPIKAAFGRYLYGFQQQLSGDTPAVREFAAREFAKAVMLAPGRMADSVEDMLQSWRKNDTSEAAQPSSQLPVVLVAMGKGFSATPGDFTANRGDWVEVQIPSDPKGRLFKMRAVTRDIRAVVLIAAGDEPSAGSLAMQLQGYCSEMHNRRFGASFPLAGIEEKWPVVFEMPDVLAIDVPTEVKNLTLLTVEFTLRATVPMLKAPRSTDPNDGRGGANADNPHAANYDPPGYLVVSEAHGTSYPPHANAPAMGTWTVQAEE